MSAKREKLIEAALKLFCEKGFQNTSTANISKEAGVATGTLFLYFPSKEELINTLYKEKKQQLAQAFQEGLLVDTNIKNKLKHIWEKAVEWAIENKYAFRFLMMYNSSPFISNLTKEEAAASFSFTETFINDGIEQGIFLDLDPQLFQALFGGHWTATVDYLTQRPQIAQKQSIIEQTFNLFWKGVSKE